MTTRNTIRFLLAACVLSASAVSAQGFSAVVSPPRFEDSAKPGTTYRNVVEIDNVSAESAHFTVKTADWTLLPDGGVQFSDALAADSCRPWVGIEAADITLGANGKRRYRFEVAIPAAAPRRECRFALMIEGDPEPVKSGIAIPVSGRIAVIVYLSIGDAAPRLEITGQRVAKVDGQDVPVLQVRNDGDAHGRLQGFVDGTDAGGKRYAFAPSTSPIMPGETRDIPLQPQPDDPKSPPPVLAFPVKLQGRLDSGAQRIDIAATVAR
ncbi:hypothetical protein FNZ56_04965 [Pseudoluteimonas lycopersici]|uniref:Molecular chaperone n=1 Tax=Pseudoluteimonas lycopersici TaxID=1324796 RepID=A0A516V3Z4_9GAMM|nr:hypothetical protein [Lysobacter lycopersici]QDQ73262.1 hypothetical protein FNZ56_04965 [Lysobacter lycopersici]